MRKLIIALFILAQIAAHSQALRDINYSYLYNPDEPVRFTLQPVRLADSWKILYSLELKQDNQGIKNYIIEWQGRDALSTKDGVTLNASIIDEKIENATSISGFVSISLKDAPKIFVAKVINGPQKQAYIYYVSLEENYPVTSHLSVDSLPLAKKYTSLTTTPIIADSTNWTVFYYNDNFPPAAPAFSEGQAKVSKKMEADSTFTIPNGHVIFFKKGLYLFQKDTAKAEGFAIRAENDYPRFTLIQNLTGPMIYICTKQEYDKLEAAKGEKKAFDRTILSITGDAERAKQLIRNYFRRVEMANVYFTSFKEGWKTDRGMIYIIFGRPEEVYKFSDREVWSYNTPEFKATFNFAKAGNIFAPDNYVLIRDKKYQTTWYEVIDLWRKVRF
jgi:GWxTD domain-containing protein